MPDHQTAPVELPCELMRKLEAHARENGTSVDALLRQAVEVLVGPRGEGDVAPTS